ncbi:MAG: CBS domain-containing protein [Hyphomicrobiales bacterium]|jgi:CBS domain-containing protein|nr:CBS domain-containing protein [Hyphomicrobiales bacterium]
MTTVKQLLDAKGREVWSISPDGSVYDAIKMMADKNIGAVVIVKDDLPVGIFTERSYARNVFLRGKASPTTRVGDIMETRVICAEPDETIEQCMAVMSDKRVRHLPVLEKGRLAGIVSIGDLVKAVIADQQFVIEQLEHYIHR